MMESGLERGEWSAEAGKWSVEMWRVERNVRWKVKWRVECAKCRGKWKAERSGGE